MLMTDTDQVCFCGTTSWQQAPESVNTGRKRTDAFGIVVETKGARKEQLVTQGETDGKKTG